MLAGYLLILLLVGWANAGSTLDDLARAAIRVPAWQVACWEASSMAMWLALSLPVWRAVAVLRPPRLGWPATIAAHAGLAVLLSAAHVAGAVLLRKLVYALAGDSYAFGPWWQRWPYELRKDVATYVQLAALAALCQWMLARSARAAPMPSTPQRVPALRVADGAPVRHVPVDEIDHVAAAGNYVEIAWRGRLLLHRATLAAISAELGPAFVRIHRGRLVRRAAIRSIQVAQSGDFELVLASGDHVRGSRRYRGALDGKDGL